MDFEPMVIIDGNESLQRCGESEPFYRHEPVLKSEVT